MLTKSQIEAARYTLRTPFDYPESEAMRKLILWLLDHAIPAPLPPTKKVRKPRRSEYEVLEIILSEDPPSVLMERYALQLEAIKSYKAGYGNYLKFGGCPDLWKDYRLKHRAEVHRLTSGRNDNSMLKEST